MTKWRKWPNGLAVERRAGRGSWRVLLPDETHPKHRAYYCPDNSESLSAFGEGSTPDEAVANAKMSGQ